MEWMEDKCGKTAIIYPWRNADQFKVSMRGKRLLGSYLGHAEGLVQQNAEQKEWR